MTKNKKAIGVGIAAFVTGLNKLSNILYSGSDFLNPYIEKVDKIESNNREDEKSLKKFEQFR